MTTPIKHSGVKVHVATLDYSADGSFMCGMPVATLAAYVHSYWFNDKFFKLHNEMSVHVKYYMCPECQECLPLLAISEMGL